MHRDGKEVIFNTAEQEEFGVSERVPIESALDTADGFSAAAMGIVERALNEVSANSQMASSVAKYRLLERQAARLGGFAGSIYELCSDEHLERIANPKE